RCYRDWSSDVCSSDLDRVVVPAANHFPEARISQAEEGFPAGASIGDLGPGVAVEQWNIPLDASAKFGIMAGLGTTEAAISNVEIKRGVGGHTPEDRGHILDRMGGNGQYTVPSLIHRMIWHGMTRYF